MANLIETLFGVAAGCFLVGLISAYRGRRLVARRFTLTAVAALLVAAALELYLRRIT